MIGKIIAYAPTRKETMSRLKRALHELTIAVENGTTNKAFLLELLNQKQIIKGGIHTGFVEEYIEKKDIKTDREKLEAALIAGALNQHYHHYKKDFVNFKEQLMRIGRPRNIPDNLGYEVTLAAEGNSYTFLVKQLGENYFEIEFEDKKISCKSIIKENRGTLLYKDKRYNVLLIPRGDQLQCEIDGYPVLLENDSGGWVRSPSPAIILSINCQIGQVIKKGDVLGILEAMKMEMLLEAPADGVIKEITKSSGEQVTAGQPLILMESGDQSEENERLAPPVKWKATFLSEADHKESLKRELLGVFLGYDHRENLLELLDELGGLEDLNGLYVTALEYNNNIERLFQSVEVETTSFTRPLTYEEMLSHYFRRGGDREKGLPEEFVNNLKIAICCYSVPELAEGERQNHALFHIFKSHSALTSKEILLKGILYRMQDHPLPGKHQKRFTDAVNETISLSLGHSTSVVDMALHLLYVKINRIKSRISDENYTEEIRNLISRIHITKEDQIDRRINEIADSPSVLIRDLINLIIENEIHL